MSTKGSMPSWHRHLVVRWHVWLSVRFGEERGATLTEYALLVALIAVTCIASIDYMGGVAADKLAQVGSSIGQP